MHHKVTKAQRTMSRAAFLSSPRAPVQLWSRVSDSDLTGDRRVRGGEAVNKRRISELGLVIPRSPFLVSLCLGGKNPPEQCTTKSRRDKYKSTRHWQSKTTAGGAHRDASLHRRSKWGGSSRTLFSCPGFKELLSRLIGFWRADVEKRSVALKSNKVPVA